HHLAGRHRRSDLLLPHHQLRRLPPPPRPHTSCTPLVTRELGACHQCGSVGVPDTIDLLPCLAACDARYSGDDELVECHAVRDFDYCDDILCYPRKEGVCWARDACQA